MCPPTPTPPADIGSHCTDEELFMSIKRMIDGSPLPSNVVTDVNPYHYMPSNLPGGIWYFKCSEEKKDTDIGFWKFGGGPCKIFSNSVLTGWRSTLEFYEGKAPHGHKTDWVTQEYWITQKGQCESSNAKERNSLCRIFLSDKQSSSSETQQNLAGDNSAGVTHIQSTELCVSNTDDDHRMGSIHEPQVYKKDAEAGPLAAIERHPNHPIDYPPEIDYLSRGDFLELLDLDNPESPSSCSENSSCLSIFSDECFDSLALLKDLENKQDLMQKDARCKFSISVSLRPNEVVMCQATSGSLRSVERSKPPTEEIPTTDCSIPGLASQDEGTDNKAIEHATRYHKADCMNAGPSRNSSSILPVKNRKRKTISRMKSLKNYMCFMPF